MTREAVFKELEVADELGRVKKVRSLRRNTDKALNKFHDHDTGVLYKEKVPKDEQLVGRRPDRGHHIIVKRDVFVCTMCLRWGPSHEKISDSRCPGISAVVKLITPPCQETENNVWMSGIQGELEDGSMPEPGPEAAAVQCAPPRGGLLTPALEIFIPRWSSLRP